MITDFTLMRVVGVIYIVILLLLFLVAAQRLKDWKPSLSSAGRMAAGLFFLALVIRLIPALVLPVGAFYDITSYQVVGDVVLRGGDVYTDPVAGERHPYLPLIMYFLAGARAISLEGIASLVLAIKIPLVILDSLIVIMLFVAGTRLRDLRSGAIAAILYAVNPIPVLVTGYHGQFDSIPILFSLLSWFTLMFPPVSRQANVLVAGLFLGLGILVKTWPGVLLPPLLLRIDTLKRKALFALLCAVPVLIGVGAYLLVHPGSLGTMLVKVLSYGGLRGSWGYLAPVGLAYDVGLITAETADAIAGNAGLLNLVLIGAGLAILYRWSLEAGEDMLNAMLTTLLTFLAVTIGFSIQYLLWLVPFAILVGVNKYLKWYTVLSTLLLGCSLLFAEMGPPAAGSGNVWYIETPYLRLLGLLTWICVVIWLVARLRRGARQEAPTG